MPREKKEREKIETFYSRHLRFDCEREDTENERWFKGARDPLKRTWNIETPSYPHNRTSFFSGEDIKLKEDPCL